MVMEKTVIRRSVLEGKGYYQIINYKGDFYYFIDRQSVETEQFNSDDRFIFDQLKSVWDFPEKENFNNVWTTTGTWFPESKENIMASSSASWEGVKDKGTKKFYINDMDLVHIGFGLKKDNLLKLDKRELTLLGDEALRVMGLGA